MTDTPRRISPWWRIAIVLVVVWAASVGWKLSANLPPEQQRTGLTILTVVMGATLLITWVVRGFRRRGGE